MVAEREENSECKGAQAIHHVVLLVFGLEHLGHILQAVAVR